MAELAAPWDKVHVIGIDDGGPIGLSETELALIQEADLVVGGSRHLDLFPGARAERLAIKGDLTTIYDVLDRSIGCRRIVVVASGDPCFFGIGPLIAERLGRDRVLIHPHVSSVATAFARLGLAWQDAKVLSVHGRPIEDALPEALGAAKLAFLTDQEHTPAAVARALIEAGMDDCTAYVCERLGSAKERIVTTSLSELPKQNFDPLNVLILLPNRTTASAAFGRPDADYAVARGQLTKAEVRAVTLARLEPWRANVAWDVGAGSGSVAIELAGLMPTGTLYAVERDPEQLRVLLENIRRHHAAGVRIVYGSAPTALEALPDPDAVFIGGHGFELEEILTGAAKRLKPGGRLVANFAQIESLAIWQRIAGRLIWPSEVVQVSVARGAPIAGGTRLAALNPVFVTRLERPVDSQ